MLGGNRHVDQVVRQELFTAAHPGVRIEHRRTPWWHWRAIWTAPDGTPHEIEQLELGSLLNMMEARFPVPPLDEDERLERFRAAHPEIRLMVHVSMPRAYVPGEAGPVIRESVRSLLETLEEMTGMAVTPGKEKRQRGERDSPGNLLSVMRRYRIVCGAICT
jgi:hypothetical protein